MAPRGRRRPAESAAPPTVVSGLLGDPGDDDRIEVTFRVVGERVRLTAGEHELGSWLLADVGMTAAGRSLWYFEAEGDRLAFVPSRPAALEASALVTAASERRRRRDRGGRVVTPDPTPRPDTDEPPTGEPPIARMDHVARERAPRRPRIPRVSMPRFRVVGRSTRRSGPTTTPPGPSGSGDTPSRRRRYWLGSIDFARRRGFFGLDRLPVDEADRDGEHRHTWDHPAAASSGPAQWVCTICGGIRR